MQYASGPNYLSRFLSFINSTVRPRLTKLLPDPCKRSDDVILILMPVLHHTVMGAAPEDVQSLRAPREPHRRRLGDARGLAARHDRRRGARRGHDH